MLNRQALRPHVQVPPQPSSRARTVRTASSMPCAEPTALKLASEARIDAALIDVHLGDGLLSFPVCDVLTRRSVPFLFVTGTRVDIPAKFCDAAVVEKPYSPADLMAALTLLWASPSGVG
jgi:hypothetical protein